MNKFNVKRKVNATKARKHQTKLQKKHSGKRKQHQRQIQQVSGKRTGKAKRKAAKKSHINSKEAKASGDVEMQSEA